MFQALKSRLSSIEDRLTLKQQVGGLTVVLCVAVIAAFAVTAALIAEYQARTSAERQLSAVATAFADRLDRSLSQRTSTLALLSSLPVLRRALNGSSEEVRPVLDHIMTYIPGAAWLGVARLDGTITAASGGALEGVSVADKPWFKNGLAGPTYEDVHEATLLAPLLPKTSDGQPHRLVDVAVPLLGDDGKPVGVLALHINWSWVTEMRNSLVFSEAGTHALGLWILSKDGEILLGPQAGMRPFPDDRIAVMRAEKRNSFISGEGEQKALFGFAQLETINRLGWFVVAREPTSVALDSARRMIATMISMGIVMIFVGFGGAIVIAGRVSKPLKTLTSEVDRIGRDSNDMVTRVSGSLEVVHLSSAIRSLLLRLGNAEQHSLDVETRAADEARRLENDIASLRSIVDIDELTGILNRRGFLLFAEDAMTHFRRYGREFGVLMIDIDHFKSVNDTHGHAAGDAAIKSVARMIEGTIRPSDKCGRFGGEEFVVLLNEVSEDGMTEAAERLRAAIASRAIPVTGADLLITISVGIAVAEDGDRDIQDIIERADLALYSAKGAGRNRVAFARSPSAQRRLSA